MHLQKFYNHQRHSCHDTKESISPGLRVLSKLQIMKAPKENFIHLIIPKLSTDRSVMPV
jgi:hypothetical protein